MALNPTHHPWYSTARWQRRRAHQLREFPLCVTCEAKGLPVPATVADHVTPHHGDSNAFWFGELQSLCATCHNSTKKRGENQVASGEVATPYSLQVGEDGWPIDPNHPANLPRHATGAGGIGRPHVLIKTKGGGGRIKNLGLAKVRPPGNRACV